MAKLEVWHYQLPAEIMCYLVARVVSFQFPCSHLSSSLTESPFLNLKGSKTPALDSTIGP